MLKIEKKILEWAERYLYQIAILMVCLIALYLRRGAVWWTSPDVGYYFDWHENHTQSSFYYALVMLVQHLPMLPLHGMKWLYSLADFAVVFFCVKVMDRDGRRLTLRKVLFLIALILSPVAFLRGAVWAQPDSAAFCLILAGYLMWNRGWRKWALIPAGLGAALYPCFLLFILGYLWIRSDRGEGRMWLYFTALSAGVLAVQGLCSTVTGNTWREGILTCFRWMAYEPYEGVLYKQDGLEWVLQMINVCGYGAAMTGLLLAYRRRISCKAVLLIHLAVLMVYGSLLFPTAA